MTPKPRRWLVPVALVVVIAGAGVGAAVWATSDGGSRHAAPPPSPFSTATVVRGKVQEETVVSGTLRLAGQRSLAAGRAGVVTWLPGVGTRLRFGTPLYAIDNQPVVLLRGSVPAWRGFRPGMTAGPDVLQLEQALQAMGYLYGPADHRFRAATTAAIERWQSAQGQPRTGRLAAGAVVFGARESQVAGRPKPVGAQVGPGDPILGVSSGQTVVRAAVSLDDQRLARRGAKVTVALPDGSSSRGTVTRVGAPTEQPQGSGGEKAVVLPTTIGLRRQRGAARFLHAAVSVRFVSAEHDDVLSVPVEALVAIDDKTFGVEVPTTNGASRRIPVRTGLFTAGRVQISGPGVRPGLDVVVPAP